MADHQFQLVLEFAGTTQEQWADYRSLLEKIELAFERFPDVLVDGWDYGSGYFNIFIHTDTPQETFQEALTMVRTERPGLPFRAGFRNFEQDNYVALYPNGLETFELR